MCALLHAQKPRPEELNRNYNFMPPPLLEQTREVG
jgi:hypothetical protein